jgi:uncharacterized protein (DUF2147 family)
MPSWFAAVSSCIVTLLLPLSAGADAGQDAIVGAWLTDGGESKVEIARSGSQYAGRIVWLKEPERDGKPLRDSNNSNAALRDRPMMGLEVLSGFSYAAGGVWSGGSVYSPRKGRTYPAELSLARDGRLVIKVKDGIFSQHVYWSR